MSLFALECVDLEHMLHPKRIVYPRLLMVGGLLVLAAAMTGEWSRLPVAGICAAVWFAVFFTMNFASPRSLGFGDVRLGGVLGLGLGWLGWRYVVLGFFSANLIGAVIGMTLIATKRMSSNQQVPQRRLPSGGHGSGDFRGPELLALLPPVAAKCL